MVVLIVTPAHILGACWTSSVSASLESALGVGTCNVTYMFHNSVLNDYIFAESLSVKFLGISCI